MRGQWGVDSTEIPLKKNYQFIQETFILARNVCHSRAQVFNLSQLESETMDEYWKRLVEEKRKCEFNIITPEEIFAYKFVATVKNKHRGPLNIQLISENIEKDNYDRKYGVNNGKVKKKNVNRTRPMKTRYR